MVKTGIIMILALLLTGCAATMHTQEAVSSGGTRVQLTSLYAIQGDFATSIHTRTVTYPWGEMRRESDLFVGSNLIMPEPGAAPKPIPKPGRSQTGYWY